MNSPFISRTRFKFIRLFVLVFVTFVASFVFATTTHAQERSYHFKEIDVNIDVNEDSTMDVNEKLTYTFNGKYHAVVRSILLDDDENVQACKNNPALQCGGFEYIKINSVKGQQKELSPAKSGDTRVNSEGRTVADPEFYIVQIDNKGGNRYMNVTWVFSEPGINFDNQLLEFEIDYTVFGSLGYFDDYDLFYWNAIFHERDTGVRDAFVTINSPQPITANSDNFSTPGTPSSKYTIDYSNAGKSMTIHSRLLLPYEGMTILLKYPKGVIQEYATLNLDLNPETQDVLIDKSIFLEDIDDRIAGIPPGTHEFTFSAKDREPQTFTLDFEPGEQVDYVVNLGLTRAAMVKLFLQIFLNIAGLLLLPIGVFMVYRLWRTRGRDKIEHKVTVPEYNIPDGIKPFALGSIKDERVDMVDITATIIDLAYRGFIKIKEYGSAEVLGIKIKQPEFEFTVVKQFVDLTEPESKIVEGIFEGKDRVTTEDLKNKFYKKIPGIQSKIYNYLASEKYFTENPNDVRTRYMTYAVALIVIGLGGIFSSFILPFFVGFGVSMLITGVFLAIFSRYMPAKTEAGSKLFHKILGFKMYLETAEKYRVQNLTPEMFEKFLSYAIVFGIEKQWAEKFKDIYKGKPSWYEGRDPDVFTTIYLANALSRFNTTTAQAMSTAPSSSGSSTGGGWSGGSGFSGGFSGGGGGGGGGGAW